MLAKYESVEPELLQKSPRAVEINLPAREVKSEKTEDEPCVPNLPDILTNEKSEPGDMELTLGIAGTFRQ
jgi:hypothetical protein